MLRRLAFLTTAFLAACNPPADPRDARVGFSGGTPSGDRALPSESITLEQSLRPVTRADRVAEAAATLRFDAEAQGAVWGGLFRQRTIPLETTKSQLRLPAASVTLGPEGVTLEEVVALPLADGWQVVGVEALEVESGALELSITNRLAVATSLELQVGGVFMRPTIVELPARSTRKASVTLGDAEIEPYGIRLHVRALLHGPGVVTSAQVADAFSFSSRVRAKPRSLRTDMAGAIGSFASVHAVTTTSSRAADANGGTVEQARVVVELQNGGDGEVWVNALVLSLVGADGQPVAGADGQPLSMQLISEEGPIAPQESRTMIADAPALMRALLRSNAAGRDVQLKVEAPRVIVRGRASARDRVWLKAYLEAPIATGAAARERRITLRPGRHLSGDSTLFAANELGEGAGVTSSGGAVNVAAAVAIETQDDATAEVATWLR